MFGIGKWIDKKFSDSQMSEATRYLEVLKGAGQEEIDIFAASVMFWRAHFLSKGLDFSGIIQLVAADPTINILIGRVIKSLQSEGALSSAAGLMLWLHTARSAMRPELRYTAKRMWEQLERCKKGGYSLAEELCREQQLSFSTSLLNRPIGLGD